MDLSSNVEKILGIVTKLAVQEFWLAWGLESDLKKLEISLSSINAVLQDAQEQRAPSHGLSLWLRQLKHVLYNAEDVLDEFAYEVLRKQVVNTHGGIKRKVCRYFSSSNPVVYRLRIGHRVKDIRQRLDEINSNKNEFNLAANLKPDNGHVNCLEGRKMTYSSDNTFDIIGRDADRETVVQFLVDSRVHDEHIPVFPIVGMGGLGKTALNKMILNDQRVVECFEQKVWVCLGDIKEFSVNQVMANIVKFLTGEKSVDSSNPQHLQNVIRGELQNQRYLLILDDMWDANRSSWLEFKTLLACGLKGSKILVTTRNSSVASCVGTVPPHKLQGLPLDECILLFKKMAFSSEGEADQNLMKIGVEIVKKCRGVPLAVRSLGSLLFSKSDEHEWLEVRDSGIWKEDESGNDILSILKFSYDYLPSHLKQCFVYCSVFPEDYEFNYSSLILYWMAHGLLQSPKSRQRGQVARIVQPEYIGTKYIDELLSRGFFQDDIYDSWPRTFKMHDLVRELACSLGGEEFAIITVNTNNICENVRHVMFDTEKIPTHFCDANIQTVLASGPYVSVNSAFVEACISNFKHLKVLNLGGSEFEELPIPIGTLKHLRSLDLSGCKRLRILPNPLCKLHNLQTLLLAGCEELEELPTKIGELINLRRLEITTRQKQLPKNGVECLTSLQYLLFFECPNLEVLFEGTQPHLTYVTSLQTLEVCGCQRLISLFKPSTGVNYYLPALEVLEVGDCANLNLNSLEDQQEHEDDSAIVSRRLQLPTLKRLVIDGVVKLENTWPKWIQECASTLQVLVIETCENLAALPDWLPNLTSLQRLVISYCYKLESLPQGMERLTALKELEITSCSDELRERCNKERGEYWPMIAHVPNPSIQ